ncbi:MAG: hypothetical protein KC547_12345, partial [Anaerolineae bacterium]|nr:hypothetical protein [Anaerolineae bacterium]
GWGTPLAGDWNGPGSLAAELMPFSENWDAVTQRLSAISTDYSLEDLLRFALDPSNPIGVVPTVEPPTATATSEPVQVKPTPQAMPEGVVAPENEPTELPAESPVPATEKPTELLGEAPEG